MNPPTPSDLLAQITQIQLMERGKLTPYTFPDRPARPGPYYKLQHWEAGKNVTRHIPADQVPLLKQALAGYTQFQALVEQYAQRVIDQTRAQLATVGVKKKTRLRPNSCWPRTGKSGS